MTPALSAGKSVAWPRSGLHENVANDAPMGRANGIDWEVLARMETHPIRMVIIETMRTDPREPRWSPIELSRTLSVSLNTLSYHVTYLRDAGVITVTPSVVQSML